MARCFVVALFLSLSVIAAAQTADLPGCKDLRTLSRIDGCIATECSAKRRDSVKFQMAADRQEVIEGPATSISYQCAPPASLESIGKALEELTRQTGYAAVYQDSDEAASRILTVQRGGHWVDLDLSSDNSGGVTYTVSGVDISAQRAVPGEVCDNATAFALPKGCQITECAHKRKDKTEMRRGAEDQATFDGAVHVSAISCGAAMPVAQVFDVAQLSLKAAGYELVYSEREQPEYSWLTMKSGRKWVELMSFQDGDALAYQLTEAAAPLLTAQQLP